MDNPIVIVEVIAAGAVIAVLAVLLGFKIPARKLLPDLDDQPAEIDTIDTRQDLPAPLRRFFTERFADGIPLPKTVVAWGRGKFRIRKMPLLGFIWAPVAWTLHLIPGQVFVWRMRVYWFRRLVVDGGDEYRGGRGQFVFGHKPVVSEHLDRSQWIAMWLYTLCFAPAVLLDWPGLTLEAVDDMTVKATISGHEAPLEIGLIFDPVTGNLTRLETTRPASRDGKLFPFQLTLESSKDWGYGVSMPGRMSAAWEGDFYNAYDVEGVSYNGPVAEVLEEGVD